MIKDRLFLLTKFFMVFFCLSIFGLALADGETITVIPLQHRSAQEIIPIIKPLMPAGSVVTGDNYNLIVKTTPENLAQIREMLITIDKAAATLMISVRQGSQQQRQQQLSAAAIPVIEKNAQAVTQSEQKISTLDGQAAFIQMGQAVPITTQVQTPTGAYTQTTYQNVATGFYVTPHLTGKQVIMDINPQRSQLGRNGTIKFQNAQSQLSVPLGQWVQMGSITTNQANSENIFIFGKTSQSNEAAPIYIKVDLMGGR